MAAGGSEGTASAPPDDAPPGLAGSEIRRRAVLSAMVVGARGVAIHIAAFGGNVVLARMLVPSEFGVVALGLALLTLGSLFADGGLGAGLVRRPEAPTTADLRALVALQTATTTTIAALALVVGLRFGTTGGVAGVMMLGLPLEALRGPVRITLQRDLQFGPIAASEIAEVVVYYGLGIALVAAGLGVWGLAIAAIAKVTAGTVVLLLGAHARPLAPLYSAVRIRELLRFGVRFQAIQLVTTGRDQGASIGTGAFGGFALLGLWTAAWKLLQVPYLLFDALWRVSFPAIAQLLATGEDPRRVIERVARLTAVGAGALLTMLAGASPALVPAVFGEPYAGAADVMPFACLALLLSGPISVATAGYLMASGRVGLVLRAAILHMVVWFGLAFPLLDPLGVAAVGVGYVAAGLVESVIFARETRRGCGARVVGPVALPAAAAIVGAAAGWFVAGAVSPNVAGAVAGGATAAGLYAAIVGLADRSLLRELGALVRQATAGLRPGRAAMTPATAAGPGAHG